MAVSWTKNWSASDDGSVFAGADIENIQNNVDTAVDLLISAPSSIVQGDVVYYTGSAWARLPAGTSGQYLKTLGSGANPAWGSGFEYVTNTDCSAVANINFIDIAAGYDYLFSLTNVEPAGDATNLEIRTNNDNSSSAFDSTAGDYADLVSASDTSIKMSATVGNATGEGISCTIFLYNPGGTGHTHIDNHQGMGFNASGVAVDNNAAGKRSEAAAVDAIRFFWADAGNFTATGNFAVFRRKRS